MVRGAIEVFGYLPEPGVVHLIAQAVELLKAKHQGSPLIGVHSVRFTVHQNSRVKKDPANPYFKGYDGAFKWAADVHAVFSD